MYREDEHEKSSRSESDVDQGEHSDSASEEDGVVDAVDFRCALLNDSRRGKR